MQRCDAARVIQSWDHGSEFLNQLDCLATGLGVPWPGKANKYTSATHIGATGGLTESQML